MGGRAADCPARPGRTGSRLVPDGDPFAAGRLGRPVGSLLTETAAVRDFFFFFFFFFFFSPRYRCPPHSHCAFGGGGLRPRGAGWTLAGDRASTGHVWITIWRRYGRDPFRIFSPPSLPTASVLVTGGGAARVSGHVPWHRTAIRRIWTVHRRVVHSPYTRDLAGAGVIGARSHAARLPQGSSCPSAFSCPSVDRPRSRAGLDWGAWRARAPADHVLVSRERHGDQATFRGFLAPVIASLA